MTKISHHFRIDEDIAKKLGKLATFYTAAQKTDAFLPPKKITKTDIVEWLIEKEYKDLQEQGFDVGE